MYYGTYTYTRYEEWKRECDEYEGEQQGKRRKTMSEAMSLGACVSEVYPINGCLPFYLALLLLVV